MVPIRMWPPLRMVVFEGAKEGSTDGLTARIFADLDGADGIFCCLSLG
jgi:hypothetical protein